MIRTWKIKITHYLCVFTEWIGLAPKGTVDTHHVLIEAAHSLINAGEKNIFTPMHFICF